ncbi:Signal transduction histidine kinase [Pedobacter westerhofensis]|uniref:histidine kinase n=1 Tax=Pedobacter westerhofensis TaxID=425512 RepID=A0A521AIM8_9SPHI|nr:response regulator [Pedobacter westerhofensis]SMO34662.1 Signal transduction histidine kinase [Pedobacter westerhofensis]
MRNLSLSDPFDNISHFGDAYLFNVKKRSDKLINYFLIAFFITGLFLAGFYDTWNIAIGVGGLTLLAYYSVKWAFPESNLYQYVLSVCFGIFMAQFIYQMHGMFEMHFFAYIGSAILITYQNWRLQIPMMIFVVLHHMGLNYLQSVGYGGVYFTTFDYLETQTIIFHILLTAVIFFICGLWGHHLRKYNGTQLAMLSYIEEKKQHQEVLEALNNELKISNQVAVDARQEAERAAQAKSIFLATMSHEIRTPMNGVIGMTSLLSETSLNDEQRDYVNVISTSGEALLNVINDILDYSKIESGHLDLEEQNFELHKCIEDVIDLFTKRAAVQKLDLLYEIDHNLPETLIGDGFRLRQILINLISNAMKFTQKGEVHLCVEQVAVDENVVSILFEIRDTGIGIPEEKLSKLFKPFSQVDSSNTRKFGGTGLGLVISEKLVNLMHGAISVRSKLDEGTVFAFTIKAIAGTEAPQATVFHDPAQNIGKKVLVVDDNHTNLRILKGQLELWNFLPTICSNPGEALEMLLSAANYDLVITDMQMPDMDGVELAQKIKENKISTPVILLSSVGDESKHKYPDLFSAVLNKPAKTKQLRGVIHQTLHLQATANQPQENHPAILKADFAISYPLQILIAEDHPINLKLAMKILHKLGYDPDFANNGHQAVEMYTGKNYDLILMDVLMPEMDGLEATKIIRNSSGVQPKIIAMTANVMSEDKNACFVAGMDDYLSKPLHIGSLLQLLSGTSIERIQNKSFDGLLDDQENAV